MPDLAQSAYLVDAAVCVVAGDDFIAGGAMNPENRSLAEREGWIWTAAPMSWNSSSRFGKPDANARRSLINLYCLF